jgi:hypothetical protein
MLDGPDGLPEKADRAALQIQKAANIACRFAQHGLYVGPCERQNAYPLDELHPLGLDFFPRQPQLLRVRTDQAISLANSSQQEKVKYSEACENGSEYRNIGIDNGRKHRHQEAENDGKRDNRHRA